MTRLRRHGRGIAPNDREASPTLSNYKVASIQAAPVFLNKDATLEKASRLIDEAASNGAALVVFPETWVPGYPVWASFVSRWNDAPTKKVYNRLYKNSVDIPGPVIELLGKAARKAGVFIVIGVHERTQSGTIFNTIIFIGRDGQLLGKHRKLVPTYHERMIWGYGDASTLNVFKTEIGYLGGLVCWEHWMPLARYALYAKGEQVHAALWPTASETSLIACRNMAFEGKVFVVLSCSYFLKSMIPNDFELMSDIEGSPESLFRGGSAIIGPDAKYIAGPIYDQEAILYADIDLAQIVEEKQILDVVGHYSRPEVFTLNVDCSDMSPATFCQGEEHNKQSI